jgi:hypothetical protein
MTRLFLTALLLLPAVLSAQTRTDGTLVGVVIDAQDAPVAGAIVEIRAPMLNAPRATQTDSAGRFSFERLWVGPYDLTVRRVGYQTATLADVRVASGRPTEVRVLLTQTAARLSTVQIVASATQVDVNTPAQVERLERKEMARLATGRDAASLVGLVPGSRVGAVWGGGGDLSNNVQIDGVAAGHPGIGGDFLRPSVDWIERLEVRGLGAGADQGNFQGGVINAVTRTGTDRREVALRANLEATSLSESNFNLLEEGVEQAARREVSGEASGPIVRGKLHYFLGGQAVARELRVPDLSLSNTAVGFRDTQTELREARGIGKLTWRPDAAGRLDFLVGASNATTERAGLTGVDDPSSTQRVRAPSLFYELAWAWDRGAKHAFDLRLVGYTAREERSGYDSLSVPAVRAFSRGREPGYQNSDFSERRDPSSIALKGTWRANVTTFGLSHRLLSGVELGGGRWRQDLQRNGGMTWRPFPDEDVGVIDPADPNTWAASGSQWGGEIRLRSEVRNAAIFVQDEIALGGRLTLSPGIRASAWEGILRAESGLDPSVRATGLDPRIGLAWDVLGDGTTALKAHWGRYHQGMAASLFDRLAGAEVYSNERFYLSGPRPLDPRVAVTPEERDATFLDVTGAPLSWRERRYDESGRADGYRQPYMDQFVLAAERSLGQRWKVEVVYSNRQNRNIVGLVDRNLATNHTPIRDMAVAGRFGNVILDPSGQPLRLPVVWIANNDLRRGLEFMQNRNMPAPPGFSYDTIATLTWNPDLAVSTLPGARRAFQQAYLALRTEQAKWSAAGSFAWTQLDGNTAGVTGTSGARDVFRAGPWVRPNEGINSSGPLGDFAELEAKLWLSAQLPWGLQGGFTITHITGERVTPFFEMDGYRYRFATDHLGGTAFMPELIEGPDGQTIFLESRGTRRYDDRTLLDLRIERRFQVRGQAVFFTAELFNALAEDAATSVKLQVDDGFGTDPITEYSAVRQRVAPRRVRIGTRIEF